MLFFTNIFLHWKWQFTCTLFTLLHLKNTCYFTKIPKLQLDMGADKLHTQQSKLCIFLLCTCMNSTSHNTKFESIFVLIYICYFNKAKTDFNNQLVIWWIKLVYFVVLKQNHWSHWLKKLKSYFFFNFFSLLSLMNIDCII